MRLQPIPQPRRAATRIQVAPFGAGNPQPGGRPLPLPSVQSGTTAFARQHFTPSNPAAFARQLGALQDEIAAALLPLQSFPLANAQMVQGLTFTSSVQIAVNHSLGQRWTGYTIVNAQGQGFAFVAVPTPATDGVTIQLIGDPAGIVGGTCTGDLLVWC